MPTTQNLDRNKNGIGETKTVSKRNGTGAEHDGALKASIIGIVVFLMSCAIIVVHTLDGKAIG